MVVPSSGADYESVATIRVGNIPDGRRAIRAAMRDEELGFLEDNRARFAVLFGERSCQWTGYLIWDVWKVRIADDAHLFLLVSDEGTCLEFSVSPARVADVADFITQKMLVEMRMVSLDGEPAVPAP